MISDAAVGRLRDVAQQPDLAGTPYTIIREIARGGMAVVYEARDARLDRTVALKVLALELSSPEAAKRVKEEAQTIARLEHPAIVPIHDAGELSDGRVFYTMKFVRGTTLGAFASTQRNRAGLLRLFLRICDALAFAHAAGIVHRDLKPENIMVGSFGEVLVMDWGVATTVNSGGDIAGTKAFMAPEQLHGAPADPRADIFGLGAILRLLASAEDGKTPRPLSAIARKAMAHRVEHRYPDASALARDVANYLDGRPVTAYPENIVERVARWTRNNAALVAIVIAYLVMRVIVLLWSRA